MTAKQRIESVRVPIFHVDFVSISDLHWLAVEALLVSHAKSINFHRLYMALIFDRLIEYNKVHSDQLSGEDLAQAAKVVVNCGDSAISARRAIAELTGLLDRDFLAIGNVSNLLFRGRSKSEAFTETAALYKELSKRHAENSAIKKTKLSTFSDARTLQRRWSKYTSILPYIHCYFVKRTYELEGNRALDHSVLRSIVPQYLTELKSVKKTKPIRLSHVQQLIFLPSKCFSEFVPP